MSPCRVFVCLNLTTHVSLVSCKRSNSWCYALKKTDSYRLNSSLCALCTDLANGGLGESSFDLLAGPCAPLSSFPSIPVSLPD